MDDLLRLVLRLVGAFYLLTAVFALRAVAMDRLLSAALNAIAPGKEHATPAERVRNRFLTVSSLLIGTSSLALLALLDLAAPLMLASVALQVVYLAYLGPRCIDPEEPPEPGSRQKSVLATGMIAAAAALACAAWWRGSLVSVSETPIAAALAAAGLIALLAYAYRLSRTADLKRPHAFDAPLDLSDSQDGGWEPPPEPDISPEVLARTAIVLNPGWGDLGARDAGTGEPLPYRVYEALLTQEERDLLADWNCLFIQVADPADPRRVAMTDPEGLQKLEELGRPIFERIAARLGPERVAFEPAPRPRRPTLEVAAVKVMADYSCYPLWFHEEERVGCFSPSELALSWSLELALGAWAGDFDDSLVELDRDEPGGPVRWSEAAAAAHAAEGRVLAGRLARELAATGRGHVKVVYHPVGGDLETIAPGASERGR
jgi:hypothetical protein